MNEFLKWLSTNPTVATSVVVSFSIFLTSATLIYLVAFLQGREISFWPPRIGERPTKSANDNASLTPHSPLIRKGSVLHTASGTKITIESDYYAGANATLYRAKISANEKVIVKIYWRGLRPGSPAWEHFKQEQRIAEILTHRNIIKTLDRGLFSGYPFIVMEYMGGGTLRDWLRTHDWLSGADILSIASQVADAIDFAHSHGIIHRDIKPGNILFESNPQGRVALGDFGIARILNANEDERDITAAGGGFIGTPGYMAPEAFMGQEITFASDIYSFGTVLFEMIAGRIPFDEFQEVYALLQTKVHKDAPDIRTYRMDVSEELAARLAQALSRDPRKRPKSARALLVGLEKDISQL